MMRVCLLLIVLLLLGPAGPVLAGKGSSGSSGSHSSGGKSYSSGSKSYSSGSKSSSGSKNYSSGSKSSSGGKSYSSGSKSYSSGSSSRPSSSGSSSRPGGSSYDSAAGGAARRAESKSIFERRSSPNIPGVPGSSSSAPRSSGKGYSERNTFPSGPVYTPGARPRSTYNDSSGKARTLNPSDARVDQLRREMNEDRWFSRNQRSRTVFVNVGPPAGYPVVTYSDPYSNLFWWWMLSQSLDYRASWAYNHRNTMDALRYRDMMDRDRALEARVRELEARNAARDPTYTPPGVDPDLMYSDDYVAAAVNPTIVEPAPRSSPVSIGRLFRSCFAVMLFGGIVVFLIWFIFVKRWGGAEPVQGRKVES